jgi:uncharacterized protein YecT (DUF1311 family)
MAHITWGLVGASLVGLSGSAMLLNSANIAQAQSSATQTQTLPNCQKPADDFERSFCDVKPNCMEPLTQLDLNFCAAWDAKVSDRKLNIAYKQVQQHYRSFESKEYRDLRLSKLTNTQLAWIKYRDTTCDWKASKFSGGSIAPMVYSGCINQLTQQRTQDLLDDLTES